MCACVGCRDSECIKRIKMMSLCGGGFSWVNAKKDVSMHRHIVFVQNLLELLLLGKS